MGDKHAISPEDLTKILSLVLRMGQAGCLHYAKGQSRMQILEFYEGREG